MDIRVTESEWEIMRVLWEHSPISTSNIISICQSSNDWSPTTIKTFISRLLDKNAISFNMNHHKREYYPLMTEKECIEHEMIATIHRVYGGHPNLVLPNFIFYGNNDSSYIKELASNIEQAYERSSNHLKYRFPEKQSIYLYSSLKRLQSALGYTNGPEWIKAGPPWGVLHMAPKEAFLDEDPNKILYHILVQLMVYKMNPNIPAWLSQGVAAYESKWLTQERINKMIASQIDKGINHVFSHPDIDIQIFQQSGGYEFSYLFVEYIVTTYGYDRIREFILSPSLCNSVVLEKWRVHSFVQNRNEVLK
ncbi:MAG: BlaI/MecI/CopY family transcriptional regulator [Bacilli bacterium]|nr:BlaI/MecI/CopY family transcriptional regulator [Bacilli bacterium]